MSELKIYSVSDPYIKYLRQDRRLTIVFDNKEDARSHTRKYLGVAFVKNDFHYFIPFSSPKDSDYQIEADGSRTIRKSIIPIIRMVTSDTVFLSKNYGILYRMLWIGDFTYRATVFWRLQPQPFTCLLIS